MEGVERNKVILVSYNEEWKTEFNRVKFVLMQILDVKGEAIKHIENHFSAKLSE